MLPLYFPPGKVQGKPVLARLQSPGSRLQKAPLQVSNDVLSCMQSVYDHEKEKGGFDSLATIHTSNQGLGRPVPAQLRIRSQSEEATMMKMAAMPPKRAIARRGLTSATRRAPPREMNLDGTPDNLYKPVSSICP